jgi:hypothetical protein
VEPTLEAFVTMVDFMRLAIMSMASSVTEPQSTKILLHKLVQQVIGHRLAPVEYTPLV